ncbi:sensor histidine kinase [Streptomyces sp. WAC06614]|uniref:sensor histidine kinase n=1 Tax=Streptomyces sp. WAC06614 TaxID=2487416 RepID=UPI000F7B2094|nr:sensor histidine kinase [Streptomyces sp. WAC06614]RSS84363.1 sensor histidine kinase [Streptomyces sp. WAC06614]
MSATEPEGAPAPRAGRRRRTVRLRTLLICLAVVPTVAMATLTGLVAQRQLAQAEHLRTHVADGRRVGEPLFRLLGTLQAERRVTAARWAGTPVPASEQRDGRAATDRAAAEFRRSTAVGPHRAPDVTRLLTEVTAALDGLTAQRDRVDAKGGGSEKALGYYTDVIDRIIRLYQDGFNHSEDVELSQESRVVVATLAAAEMVSREDAFLALAGPGRELSAAGFSAFLDAVGAHRYLYESHVVPYLPTEQREFYGRITSSNAWLTKLSIEGAVASERKDLETGVRLPAQVAGWPAAYQQFAPQLAQLTADRGLAQLAHADARADALEDEVYRLVGLSVAILLLVAGVVVLTTRSVLRRLDSLHRRTVTIAERTLPDVVERLHRGQPVDEAALPVVRGEQDEVGRISDAFARAVAVSVDGHRQLAAERHGFGLFASGIASRTGNLVSRQLSLTEDLQDAFGHDEALLAELMRADQLTVGMRRQIENLLILAGGEIPDPHTEPMRIADLLREAAAEVEDFRRIERQALDEATVEPQVISQISHLLAELLDNATRFSPPRSKVVIRAEVVADGLSVEIEDRGPRVSAASYEEMNRRLHSAPPYAVLAEEAHRLGLFVVGHLADQLGATVTLRRSVFGGTSAVVVLPGSLLASQHAKAPRRTQAPDPEPLPARTPEPVAAPAPVRAPAPVLLHTAAGLPARRAAGTDEGARPGLPQRVPQTHMTEQLREPRTPEPEPRPDTETPEEVADAWADYEEGTQTVEIELRQEQP